MLLTAPYHFDSVLDRLHMDPLNNVDLVLRSVQVPLYINDSPIVYTVENVGVVNEPKVVVSGSGFKEEGIARLSEIFQWHVSLAEIDHHFTGSDLKEIFHAHRGTPLILDFGLYDCLMRCLIHQQLNMSFAMTLTKRFADHYGELVDGVRFFPRPDRVASLTVTELRELQFSTKKAEYVIGISQDIVSGKLDLAALSSLPDNEIADRLIKLRGVGNWTVGCFLLFGLGRQNLMPFADIGIQNALKICYGLDEKPTVPQMEQYSKDWSPYLSYASLYLWRSIEKLKQKK